MTRRASEVGRSRFRLLQPPKDGEGSQHPRCRPEQSERRRAGLEGTITPRAAANAGHAPDLQLAEAGVRLNSHADHPRSRQRELHWTPGWHPHGAVVRVSGRYQPRPRRFVVDRRGRSRELRRPKAP